MNFERLERAGWRPIEDGRYVSRWGEISWQGSGRWYAYVRRADGLYYLDALVGADEAARAVEAAARGR